MNIEFDKNVVIREFRSHFECFKWYSMYEDRRYKRFNIKCN